MFFPRSVLTYLVKPQEVERCVFVGIEVASNGGQVKVPFGDCVISTMDTCIGVELCEEPFTPAR